MSRGPKIVCIVEARYGSSRLPGKVLMPILGKPMLARMLERVTRARTLDAIVVACPVGDEDNAVHSLLNQRREDGVEFVRAAHG